MDRVFGRQRMGGRPDERYEYVLWLSWRTPCWHQECGWSDPNRHRRGSNVSTLAADVPEARRQEMTQRYESIIDRWESLRTSPAPTVGAPLLKQNVLRLRADILGAPLLHMGHCVTCLLVVERWVDDLLWPSTDSEPDIAGGSSAPDLVACCLFLGARTRWLGGSCGDRRPLGIIAQNSAPGELFREKHACADAASVARSLQCFFNCLVDDTWDAFKVQSARTHCSNLHRVRCSGKNIHALQRQASQGDCEVPTNCFESL